MMIKNGIDIKCHSPTGEEKREEREKHGLAMVGSYEDDRRQLSRKRHTKDSICAVESAK